ncbi:two pore calcium channel protein 1-like [Lytechinus variegatus]|uniref:two pore calcium channel protein 1-like n=1 Tax=Lytechinus variegatus TaxID=7654 RepID=UPI001BB16E2B|nr:two pore calcium channel protein 1-like [Lytechinus variegatus]XP_041468435.1 two pore calcium channel protein 1-like [Lytechinus variegatus]
MEAPKDYVDSYMPKNKIKHSDAKTSDKTKASGSTKTSDNTKTLDTAKTSDNKMNNAPSSDNSTSGELSSPVMSLSASPMDTNLGGESIEMEVNANGRAKGRQFSTSLHPIKELDLLLAATYIKDAKYGRNFKFKTSEKHLRYYHLYNMPIFSWVLYLFIILNLSLAIFEEPAVGNLALPYWASMLLECSCLTYFSLRLLHSYYCAAGRWFRDMKNIGSITVIVLTIIDMVMYAMMYELGAADKAVRWSRPLRPVLMVTFAEMKLVRLAFSNIRKTLLEILNVLILLFLVIALFALLGRELFGNDNLKKVDEKSPYFTDFWEIWWDLYVLVTTANSPDIMMPAYDFNPWYMLYFITYIFICLYIFMSIFLAVIYKNYRKHLKNEVQKSVFNKRRKLASAWDLLKEWHGGRFLLSWGRWKEMMSMVAPKLSLPHVRLLWRVLDQDGLNFINKRTFMKLVDILNVPIVQVDTQKSLSERNCPTCYNSKASLFVRTVVSHRYFTYVFDLLIIINAFFVGFKLDEGEPYFLALFSVEIVLKMYALGFYKFFHSFWNVFDFLVIGAAVVITIIEAIVNSSETETTLDILLILRVLRLVRIINNIERFHVIVATVMNIGPSIITFGAILFVVFYIYAVIGMELYAGKVNYYGYEVDGADLTEDELYCGNPLLRGSDFYRDHYCNNNFNNILKAFIILIELMVVNQWHVISEGYVIVTNKASRLYFLFFHISVVIVIINIFIAFILEVFMVEYSLSKTEYESALEKVVEDLGLSDKIDNLEEANRRRKKPDRKELVKEMETEYPENPDDNLKFRLGKRRKAMQVTLQNMFEGELDDEDIGPEEIDDVDDIPDVDITPFPLSVDNVA